MKNWMMMFICALLSGDSVAKVDLAVPSDALGVFTVSSMTQGELLWLKGRVGEGKYISVDGLGRHCSLKVPIVLGEVGEVSVGIETVDGLSIVVTSHELNKALMAGQRVTSGDWDLSYTAHSPGVDGYIVGSINSSESFALNSRRRWISWLLEDKPTPICM
tara:strand:- start:520 stop:1002 length:483 start_codon:yes stop_codon:yes gene_type:complete